MSLLKVNEVQNYNGSSLTLTASTVSTSAQLNTGGNISVTGSINVSDDSTTRSNLGLGSIATQDSDNVTVTGGTATLGALTVSGSDSGDLVRITQTGSGNALVVEDDTNPDSSPFVIDASGNVGIGTSSINKSGSYQALTLNVPSGQYGAIELATGDTGRWYINADSTTVYDTAMNNTNRVFYTGGSERMRIDSSGNVGIGMNSPSGKALVAAVTRSDSLGQITAYYNSTYAWKIGTYSNGTFVIYADDTGNPGVYLDWRGTSWNANSDERLKTNLLPIENAVEKLCSLRTVTGRYLIDDESVSRSFLIAQDFVETFSEPLSESPDGFLGLSYTDVIPLMIAGFKEQQALIESQQSQIDALTARIEALETA
jgi:hypothetical protein